MVRVLRQLKTYVLNNRGRLLKFFTVGLSAALLNLGMLYVLVDYLDFDTMLLENVANALSMELSILYNFLLSRQWTWRDTERKRGFPLLKQLFSFHAVIASTALLRLGLFPLLQLAGIHYLLNATIGIGCAAAINYFLYDTWIFKSRTKSYE